MTRVIAATSGSVTPMYRRTADGSLVSVIPDRSEYVSPPKGTRCRLKISGISDQFDMPGYENPDELSPTVRVEFEIEKAAGNWGKVSAGKRFTELFPLKLSNRSKLGTLIVALRGQEISAGEDIDIDQFIGASFVATTKMSDGGYPKVALDTIEDGSATVPFLGRTDDAAPLADDDPDDADPDAEPVGDPFGLDDL